MTGSGLVDRAHSETLIADFSAAVAALSAVSKNASDYRAIDDSTLLELSRLSATQRQLADTHLALVAGEIAHRSAPELGHSGLAQRTGFRTAEEFVRVSTRSTARDAMTAVRMGRLVRDAAVSGTLDPATGEIELPAQPWLSAVASAITSGTLPVASAESIGNGLGQPNEFISAVMLAMAAERLVGEADLLDADRLYRRARALRDELDEEGIADRERARHEQRSLHFTKLPNGMSRLVWMLDPESSAIVGDLFDRATSPRRGGPRFVSGENKENAERIEADSRTTEQLASDVFLGLLQHGANADSTELLGTGAAAVRVLVTSSALKGRRGHGRIEGYPDPVSIETVERIACSEGTVVATFDEDGQPLDLGREQRLFSRKQRVTLAARDGGCRWPNCERSPSWTEAHHIEHWHRDKGRTDVAVGILLCKHHHRLAHNNHWEIKRELGKYWLIPPPDIDPEQSPRPMPSKSAALRDLMGAIAG
jgi:Domain of unknown function (DUF222)